MEFLIVCPLVFLAGLVDAIAGGGGLISLPAYFFAGLPVHNAIATNKLSSTMGTTVATIRYVMFGYMVKWLVVLGLVAGLFNIAGNWIGTSLFRRNGAAIVRPIMLVVIVLFAVKLVSDLVGFGA